uniref:Phospholipase A1 2 n=1 Tax=Dolichovespula maculata TaxID=7441 RepID=PA12_DOLMA|nr:RecName: Full=Phospholipase A1 2; Short=PLA1 2; AltName: Full=Allergen Dol m 1; AltName: Allergen=Dol m 1 [Dolichovespula maculata]prf//2016348B phospholipase [Dolichovespula maculata]
GILPECKLVPEEISFVLSTRENRDGVYLTLQKLKNGKMFKNSDLSSKKVPFLIHGFISSATNKNYADMTRALLDKDDIMVISIDWRDGACSNEFALLKFIGYPKAVENTRAVGKYIADFSKILIQKYKVLLENIRLIGHSLGAQIAGFAGKEFQRFKLGKYPEIIGLDPAGPSFKKKDCPERICETDAHYVQILHTSSNLGTERTLGTVDFYINDGSNQPGCTYIIGETCSHTRAVKYLTECIRRECCLIGVPQSKNPQPVSKCTRNECVCVGLNAKEYPKKGSFYVPVEAKAPFCNNNGKII